MYSSAGLLEGCESGSWADGQDAAFDGLVADLQEFHGLIDEFGKAYRDDAAKNESFLQSWRPGEAAPRPTE